MVGERFEIAGIRREHGSVGLSQRHYNRVDGRTPARPVPQEGGPSGEALADLVGDITRLEKAIGRRVATHVTLEAFHEDDRWHERRPEIRITECLDQRGGGARLLC